MDALEGLTAALVELDESQTLRMTRQVVSEGRAPLSILQACQQALRIVGERYEREEYSLSGLIMAGELFNEIWELVQPAQEESLQSEPVGTVVLGTVEGDIHDIGKSLFGNALRAFGFGVADLGVDVPKERFLAEVRQSRPDLVCLSGLVTVAFGSMRDTVALLRSPEADLGYTPPVILGGGTIDSEICLLAGADSWSTDAMEGVRICQSFLRGTTSAPHSRQESQ